MPEEVVIEEVINDGPKKPQEQPRKREEMGIEDLDGSNKYLDLKIGTTIELVRAKIEKVQDDNYCLSNSQNADGKAYKIEITDQDGQILSVTSWKLWNLMRVAFKDLNSLAPVQLRVKHPAHGEYEVEYIKESKWVKAAV